MVSIFGLGLLGESFSGEVKRKASSHQRVWLAKTRAVSLDKGRAVSLDKGRGKSGSALVDKR